jgi:nicotinate phosphoribosyltransferase
MGDAVIVASGDLQEHRIAELVAAGAPIDLWGVGTELGTSRDSPVVNGVYKLVADRADGSWRGVWKRSPHKATHPGPKQVYRVYDGGTMAGDVIAAEDEAPGGEPLLVEAMRDGEIVREDTLDEIRARTTSQLDALPEALRPPEDDVDPYPVTYSDRLRNAVDPAEAEAKPSISRD